MENFITLLITLLGVLVALAIAMFAGPLIGTFFGGIGGWVVGALFTETSAAVLTAMGAGQLSMWQVGCALGFVGGYLKTTVSSTK